MSQCPTCGESFGEKVLVCPKDGTVLTAAAPAGDPMVGRVLDDKYRLDEKLNQGGMGAVYRGTHLMLNRTVAVKLIRPELAATQDVVQRFLREARTVGLLDHPNIAQVYDLGQSADGQLYIAMEFARGDSLKEVIRKEGPLAPGRVVRILLEVAGALALAHRRDCVHRDLKPQNIMMARSDHGETAKLVDFGIAKMLDDASTQLTSTGFAIGTPQYMSPEQAAGRAVDARSDLYSLGVVLYEMLVGEVPFNDPSTPAVLVKHLTQPPPRFADRFPDRRVPPALEAVAMRCLEKDPDARYQNADEFAAALVAAAPPDYAPRGMTGPRAAIIAPGLADASTLVGAADAATVVGLPGPLPASAGLTGAPTVVGMRDAPTVHVPGTPPIPPTQAAPSVAAPRGTVASTIPAPPVVPPPAASAVAPPPPASAPRQDSHHTPNVPPAFAAPAAGVAAAAHDTHGTRARHSTGAALVITPLFVAFVGAVGFVGYRLGYWDGPGDQVQTPAAAVPTPTASPTNEPPASSAAVTAMDPAGKATPPPVPASSTPAAQTPPPASSVNPASSPGAQTTAAQGAPATNTRSSPGASSPSQPGGVDARSSRGTGPRSPAGQAASPAAAGPPAAPQPPPLPEHPSVFFRCEGVADVCAVLRSTIGDALQRASMTSLRRPDGADVTLVAEATEGPRRVEDMFGTTMVTRTFTVVVEGDSERFNETVSMPGPATFSFDDRVGRARLDEQARLIASGVTERIRAYWSKRRGGGPPEP